MGSPRSFRDLDMAFFVFRKTTKMTYKVLLALFYCKIRNFCPPPPKKKTQAGIKKF